jgi:hypothetical protein
MPTAVEDKTDPWTQALGSSAQYSSADSILPGQLKLVVSGDEKPRT